MQNTFMKIILNLNKLLIKLKMDIIHQKNLNYFMILSIVYYMTMEISMLIYPKKKIILILFLVVICF